jgi:starch synthase
MTATYLAPLSDQRSGIGRYAERMRPLWARALGSDPTVIDTAAAPTSLRAVARITAATLRASRRGDPVIVELGGRQLSALYGALVAAGLGRRVVAVLHDCPDVTGDPLAFGVLGTGRARHLVWRVARRAGAGAEAALLQRSTVCTLSDRGAAAVERIWNPATPVHTIGYPTGHPRPRPDDDEPRMLLLGCTDDGATDAVADAFGPSTPPWTVVVDDPRVGERLRGRMAVGQVVVADLGPRAGFAEALERSRLIVRVPGPAAILATHAWAAVSGLVGEAAAAGAAVVTDHGRSPLDDGVGDWCLVAESRPALTDLLRALLADPADVTRRGSDATAWARAYDDDATVDRLRAVLDRPAPPRPRRSRSMPAAAPTRHLRVALIREQIEDREVQNYLGLDAAGFEVRVVTGPGTSAYSATALGLPVTTLRRRRDLLPGASRVPGIRRRLPDRYRPEELLGFRRALRRADILCVNELHMVSSHQAAHLRATNPRTRLVTVCYENIPFRYDDTPAATAANDLVRRMTDRFVALSPSITRCLVEEGVDPSRIEEFSYGVDCRRFHPLTTGAPPPGGGVVFLYAGRLVQEKGLVHLVRALRQLPDTARLRVIGRGGTSHKIRRAVEVLGLEARVEFVEWVDYTAMPEVMRTADVFVMPSLPTPYWEEQLGFSLIEAMASGVPIVSTRSGSIPDVVGDAGILVPPYDVEALAAAMRALLDPARRAAMGAVGRARALDQFDARHQAHRLADVFEAVLGLPTRAGRLP